MPMIYRTRVEHANHYTIDAEATRVDSVDLQNRTEQNRIFIGVKSIYKVLLPKQHIKYKTKKLLNTNKLHINMNSH
jgi:hypothetical protein